MKWRYRDSFGSKAGAAWRLLFVYALLPWMHKYRIQVEGDMGFLLQGLVETTRGSIMRHSMWTSQRRLIEEDLDDTDEESKILAPLPPTAHNAQLVTENQDLKNQVEILMRKQKSLLATIRELEKQSVAAATDSKTESETEVEETLEVSDKGEAIAPATEAADNDK